MEGCNGIGKHIADGCSPMGSRWWMCHRNCPPGPGCSPPGRAAKLMPTDAHSVALVGTRMSGLRPVVDDEQLAVLRLLVDRRRSLVMTTPG